MLTGSIVNVAPVTSPTSTYVRAGGSPATDRCTRPTDVEIAPASARAASAWSVIKPIAAMSFSTW